MRVEILLKILGKYMKWYVWSIDSFFTNNSVYDCTFNSVLATISCITQAVMIYLIYLIFTGYRPQTCNSYEQVVCLI